MTAKLKNLRFTAIGLVDKGANQDAHIVLMKRDTPPVVSPPPTGVRMPEPDVLDIEKADAPTLAKLLADERERNNHLATEIAEKRASEAKLLYLAKAQGLDGFPKFDAEKYATVWQKIARFLTPEELALHESILKAANTALREVLFKELGTSRQAWGEDPLAKLQAVAKSIAATEKVTIEKAMDLAMQRNPALYREYTAQQGGR